MSTAIGCTILASALAFTFVGTVDAAPVEHQILADLCVTQAREHLHDPGSAKLPNANDLFDYPSKFYVGERRKGIVTVQFEMRARNGFNALRSYMVNCDFAAKGAGFTFTSYKTWQR